MSIKVGVAGVGAIGAAVCRALIDGIDGFSLCAGADLAPDKARELIHRPDFDLPFVPLEEITDHADWIVEALPAVAVPDLTRTAMAKGRTLVLISSAALLIHPDLKDIAGQNGGRILVPSGALAGMDGINALVEQGIRSAKLVTTKKPQAYSGAPYIVQEQIDLDAIDSARTIFSGHARAAAAAFPANVNVAATLTLASRLSPEDVRVEVRADPALTANCHEVTVEGRYSTLHFKLENLPDPANPKSSTLAALSMIATLRRHSAGFWVG